VSDADPTTEELRLSQLRRERVNRQQVEESPEDLDTGQFEARADKAAYLREKLEERAEAERAAEREE
jgi:hypothetical protein